MLLLYTCRAHGKENCKHLICITNDLKPIIDQETRKLQIVQGVHKRWMDVGTQPEEREALVRTLQVVDDLTK